MIAEVDSNGDGQIDFEEFKLMLKKFSNLRDTPNSWKLRRSMAT